MSEETVDTQNQDIADSNVTSSTEDNKDSENQNDSSNEDTVDPKANIMYIGKVYARITQPDEQTGKPKEVIEKLDGDPPRVIQNGMDTYKLPAKETQLKGPFYHKHANQIVLLFPELYKRYVKKGE